MGRVGRSESTTRCGGQRACKLAVAAIGRSWPRTDGRLPEIEMANRTFAPALLLEADVPRSAVARRVDVISRVLRRGERASFLPVAVAVAAGVAVAIAVPVPAGVAVAVAAGVAVSVPVPAGVAVPVAAGVSVAVASG